LRLLSKIFFDGVSFIRFLSFIARDFYYSMFPS
jgi:hypothetical protein